MAEIQANHVAKLIANVDRISSTDVIEYTKPVQDSVTTTVSEADKTRALDQLGIKMNVDQLDPKQQASLRDLLFRNIDLFSSSAYDIPGTDLVQFRIETGDTLPIRQRAYRHNPPERKQIAKEVEELLQHDIIEPSSGRWSFPVIILLKKDLSYRFCIDYRKLNSCTRAVYYPIPTLQDVVDLVANATGEGGTTDGKV